MPARAALLTLVFAGPGLAAPPASPLTPESDNAEILAAIDAADPAYATTPAPVEQAVAAAELAETRLATAEDVDSVAELLMLAGAGRRLAADRAPADARGHLCALRADAERVLGRPALPDGLAKLARRLQAAALDGLKGAGCPADEPPPPPRQPEPEGPPPAPATAPPVRPSVARVAVGGTLLGVSGVLVVGMAASLVARRGAAQRIDAINAAYTIDDRHPTSYEIAEGVAANDRYRRLGPLALGLGLAAGASLVAGLAVLLARTRAPSRARLRAGAAGLVYAF